MRYIIGAFRKCNILRIYALAIRLFGRDPNDKAKPVVSIGQWALLFQLASWCIPRRLFLLNAAKINRIQVQFLFARPHFQQLLGGHLDHRLLVIPLSSHTALLQLFLQTPFGPSPPCEYVTLSSCTTGLGRASPQSPAAAALRTAAGTFSRQKYTRTLSFIACNPCVRRRDMIKASVAMAVCVAVRPTSIMLWMVLALVYLQVRLGGGSSSSSSSSSMTFPLRSSADATRILCFHRRHDAAANHPSNRRCRCGDQPPKLQPKTPTLSPLCGSERRQCHH